jgi:hypothetical protein
MVIVYLDESFLLPFFFFFFGGGRKLTVMCPHRRSGPFLGGFNYGGEKCPLHFFLFCFFFTSTNNGDDLFTGHPSIDFFFLK